MSAFTPLRTEDAPVARNSAAEEPGFWARRWSALSAIFSPRSLRIRLIGIVFAMDCVAAVFAGSVIVLKARLATKAEIDSSMQLAEMGVVETLKLLEDSSASEMVQGKVRQLNSIRHVKIVAATDSADQNIEAALASLNTNAKNRRRDGEAPDWFRGLVATPVETRVFPVTVRGRSVGAVAIKSEPADEISEAWDYALSFLATMLFANVLALMALYLFFGKALAPLNRLADGLVDLERKDYSARLKIPSAREFAVITEHFNRTAEALAVAHAANHMLNCNLVDAQDNERRRIAIELHDEMGPCLFALEVNATSVAQMTTKLRDGDRINERALEVMGLIQRIQGVNRRILDSLRPIALGHLPLKQCLENLLFDLQPNDSTCSIETEIGELRESYGIRVDLTLYRCVQEGICNALRHAQASHIRVALDEIRDAASAMISIRIEDDGTGLKLPVQAGTGLSGMRERVEALNGSFELRPSSKGTTLAIHLPLDDDDLLAAAPGIHFS